jgi:hypothetical protein
VEDNVFTWAHTSPAAAPLGSGYLMGLWVPAHLLEMNGVKSKHRITGNMFLYPRHGINTALRMSTEVPTTSWAPGGPWIGGLIAGNYSSGGGFSGGGFISPWLIHWDLSGAGNVGEVMAADYARPRTHGWYSANGATLTSLDSGKNVLPRINAEKCGYASTLPDLPGRVVRLHGPMHGEGVLADWLSRYAGSIYNGSHDTVEDLRLLPASERFHGEIRAVRQPLTVYRWEGSAAVESAPPGCVEPLDIAFENPGRWMAMDCGVHQLHADADLDGDGLTTLQETGLMFDPSAPDNCDCLHLSRNTVTDEIQLRFRCAAGPHSPRVCVLSSADLEHWQLETSSPGGTVFDPPAIGSVTESSSRTGRQVILSSPGASRKFWKLAVEP